MNWNITMNLDSQTIAASAASLILLAERFQENPLGATFVLGLAALATCCVYFFKNRD
jgi:hypothetical protein